MTAIADLVLKVTLVLLVALLTTIAMPRAAAATRHLVWMLATLVALALPLVAPMLPRWEILPAVNDNALPMAGTTAIPHGIDLSSTETSIRHQTPTGDNVPPSLDATNGLVAAGFATWAAGTMILLARIAAGAAALRRLARHARPIVGPRRAVLDSLATAAGVKRSIRLLVSADVSMPMTWGTCRPVLLLPRESQTWSNDRLRVVLLHELAHVRRFDALAQSLGRVMVACHWVNPCAWIATRMMIRERERACDDYVVSVGTNAADYAQHLLEVARAAYTVPRWVRAPAMARCTQLEGRLVSILTPHRLSGARFTTPLVSATATVLLLGLASAAPIGQVTTGAETATRPPFSPPAATIEGIASDRRDASRNRLVRHALLSALDDGREDVRERAVMALGADPDEEAVEQLLEALNDRSAQVREKAALGLAFRRRDDVVAALLVAATDLDAQVRETAVFALGTSGDRRAAATLRAALRDPDQQVREKAVQGLTLLPR